MRINIYDAGDRFHLCLPIPNVLLLNTAVVGWVTGLVNRHLPADCRVHVTSAQMQQLVRALRRWRRCAPDRTLIEVKSADGDHVCIRL